LAATPVIMGSALAWSEGAAHHWLVAVMALMSALLIQIGTNLHNDAADFESGNDQAERVGPIRVTAAGWAKPEAVRRAALLTYGSAFAMGSYLIFVGGWPILLIGALSLLAGWTYSGGPYPVSHTPLGELFVWLFFGLVAVAGSAYLQSGVISFAALLTGSALGLLAAAVLMVNNARDCVGDFAAGRRTLAVLLGPRRSRQAYAFMMLTPFLLAACLVLIPPERPGGLLTFLLLPTMLGLIRAIHREEGAALNAVLANTARASFFFGVLLALGVLL
jgi:1,4-dihydroxy-2-naphthoate octaprenyltransferase